MPSPKKLAGRTPLVRSIQLIGDDHVAGHQVLAQAADGADRDQEARAQLLEAVDIRAAGHLAGRQPVARRRGAAETPRAARRSCQAHRRRWACQTACSARPARPAPAPPSHTSRCRRSRRWLPLASFSPSFPTGGAFIQPLDIRVLMRPSSTCVACMIASARVQAAICQPPRDTDQPPPDALLHDLHDVQILPHQQSAVARACRYAAGRETPSGWQVT